MLFDMRQSFTSNLVYTRIHEMAPSTDTCRSFMSQEPIVKLVQQQDYQFAIHFSDDLPPIIADEPPPLGASKGPSPAQLLAAAVANCLSDSLLFALRKFKQSPDPIETIARCEIGRNTSNRLRVLAIHVQITMGVPASSLEHLDRVLEQFEEFCTVSSSINPHIPVNITIIDSLGVQVFARVSNT